MPSNLIGQGDRCCHWLSWVMKSILTGPLEAREKGNLICYWYKKEIQHHLVLALREKTVLEISEKESFLGLLAKENTIFFVGTKCK